MTSQSRMARGVPVASLFALVLAGAAHAAQSPQIPIAGSTIPQFVQPMPTLAIAPQAGTIQTLLGNAPISMRMCEFDAGILPPGTPLAMGATGKSRVWGYIANGACPTSARDTYIGPVIVNNRGSATEITWINELGSAATTGVLAYKYSTDQTLHWADPLNASANPCAMMGEMLMNGPAFGSECAQNYSGAIPTVPHLHGGEVPPELDGGPDAWFTSDGSRHGPGYHSFGGGTNSTTYRYPNTQEAGPLWFHDHALGVTRLNVYAGMAGAYFIQDPALNLPANLPPLTEVVPVVIQDRMFDTNGQLYFPAGGAAGAPNPNHPYWIPEFTGDTIVVNGKAWPYFNVAAKRYRFLFLNGSNARTYELFLTNPVSKQSGPAIWVIGTDGGYLDNPVKIDPAAGQVLTMMPGERYEVIIDFSNHANTSLLLRNNAKTPYPRGAAPDGLTLGRIMQFRVGAAVADASYNPASGAPLRANSQAIVRLANPATGTLAVAANKTRQVTLNEVMGMAQTATDPITGAVVNYPGGPLEVLINNTKWSGASQRQNNDFVPITVNGVTTAYSEMPKEGDTEVWEIVNITADAHPIHLHLVQYQLINRQNINTARYIGAYGAAFPGGAYLPAYGPPLDYRAAMNPLSGGKDGGNPDVTPYLQGPVKPPLANEAGWKDTIIVYPGQVTRLAVRWAPTDLAVGTAADKLHYPFDPSGGSQYSYVWHCHIIDHEDNEMMRPDMVQLNPLAPAPSARTLVKGLHY